MLISLVKKCIIISKTIFTLWQEFKLCGSSSFDDFKFGSDVFLEVHCPGNTVLRGHLVGRVLDVLKLLSGQHHPVVDALQGSVKVLERGAEIINDLDLLLKLACLA